MAGMAWTLHPALFYEKYGTVLVQLWESGAFGNMFRPVRTLSKSIGDRITSLRRQRSVAAPPKPIAEAEAEVLSLTDDSVATDDEALSRVNREPGDTSPEPSTSQQNELAFQGDIYTQMRRSRRQRERLQKIRETREKFLEAGSSSSGSEFGRKRRGLHPRRGSIMAFKKDKRKASGGGTPLTDMECAVPARAVVIDVSSGSPTSAESSEDEDDAAWSGGERGSRIKPEELLEENDSLQTFRDVCSPRKKGQASPPPNVREPTESQTAETASLASAAAKDQAAVGKTPPTKKLAEPFAAAKWPRKSALRKRKVSRRASVASSGSAGEKATKTAPGKPSSIAVTDSSSAVAGGASQPQAEFSSPTSLLLTEEPIASDKRPAPTSPAESVAKKDKAKRRKPKAGSHKKKARGKSAKTAHGPGEKSPSFPEEGSYTGGDVHSGAASEDKARRKHDTPGAPSKDKVRSRVARHPIASKEPSASTGATAPSQTAEAARRRKSARGHSQPATSVRAPGELVDAGFHQGSKAIPSATDAAMVHVAGRGSHPDAKAIKRDSAAALKTAPLLRLEQWTSEREERDAEARLSAQAPVGVPRSSEAVGTSAGASRAVGVHKRHAKKHRTSKTVATAVDASSGAATSVKDVEPERPSPVSPQAVSSDSAERVSDEVVGVHHHHRRRSHGRSKRHAEGVHRRHSRKTKEDLPVDSTQLATGSALPSATLANASADLGDRPSRVEGFAAAAPPRKDVDAESTTSVVSASSVRCRVMPPTADITLTGTDTGTSAGSERHPPRATTVVEGDDVTIHVDLSSRDRAAMFWPFGRRGDKKKK
ncbi:pneumococcal serine-rich repeat protein-like [Dermacentor albipictus]|uniref:pneumococcal serine-rich repeat protein-like n=1 Tax=Dermacentor albipictus TaxID=60249 RepID=UPI0038FCB38C